SLSRSGADDGPRVLFSAMDPVPERNASLIENDFLFRIYTPRRPANLSTAGAGRAGRPYNNCGLDVVSPEGFVMSLGPARFLVRVAYPCLYVKEMPREDGDPLLGLPESCRIDNFAALDQAKNFADVCLAWNELGLGVQVEVRGKKEPPQGDDARPRGSD